MEEGARIRIYDPKVETDQIFRYPYMYMYCVFYTFGLCPETFLKINKKEHYYEYL